MYPRRGLGAVNDAVPPPQLPPHRLDRDAPSRAEAILIHQPGGKFDQAMNPGAYSIVQLDTGAKVFLAAANAGVVPLSADGYETLSYWLGAGTWALTPVIGQAATDSFWSWYRAAYNAAASGSGQTPIPGPGPTPTAVPKPDSRFPVGVRLLSRGNIAADSVDIGIGPATNASRPRANFPDAVDGIVGASLVTRLDNGQVQLEPWTPTPRLLGVRYLNIGPSDASQQTTGWYAKRMAIMEGFPAPAVISAADRIPYSDTSHILADEAALISFVQSLGAKVSAPAAWGGMLTPIVQPTPIPVAPNGSIIHVPNAASGQEPTIQLPGSSEFVPISSVPRQVWVDAAAEAVRATPSVTIVGDGSHEIVTDNNQVTRTSGFGGPLAIAALIGMVLLAKKKKGRR